MSGILTNTWGVGQVANIADGIDSYAPGLKKEANNAASGLDGLIVHNEQITIGAALYSLSM